MKTIESMKTKRKKRIFGWLALALLASCQRASESDSQALLGLIQSSAADQESAIGAQSLQSLSMTDGGNQFTVLTYNVAGLLEPFSSSNPSENTPYIGPLLSPFDVVHVQEDFNYHASLYATDVHPYRTATSGGMGIGDGMNTLAYFDFTDFQRVDWNHCNGTDCLTPKGFTLSRHTVAPGVFIDFYNVHTNAGSTDPDLAARRANISQMVAFIEANSKGNAVIVMGDTNTRYTRAGDNIRELIEHGFQDAWVQLIRGGSYPVQGADALTDCEGHRTSPGCEVVDKILFRGNSYISLQATNFLTEDARFVHPVTGVPLSDHYALSTVFSYTLLKPLQFSDAFGGPHGTAFNDVDNIAPNTTVQTISLRAGSRIDAVSIQLNDGTTLQHGGSGGTATSLTLNAGEYVQSARLCSAQKNGHTRIFYARFTTSTGRTLTGGSTTGSCVVYTAPSGWSIVGFHGRSGSEVDKLGMIYAPVN